MATEYEWVAEELSEGGEDVVETHASPDLASLLRRFGAAARERRALICLRRDRFDNVDGGLVDRQTAYLDELLDLAPDFDGGARIPVRFRAELALAKEDT